MCAAGRFATIFGIRRPSAARSTLRSWNRPPSKKPLVVSLVWIGTCRGNPYLAIVDFDFAFHAHSATELIADGRRDGRPMRQTRQRLTPAWPRRLGGGS